MGNCCHIESELEKATLENTKEHLSVIACKAKCIDVHDGDTITIAINFGTDKHPCIEWKKCRLAGINCPEISRTTNLLEIEHGLRAKEYVEKRIKNKIVYVCSDNTTEKFGRLLATVYENKTDKVSLNQQLINEGLALEYHGEKKPPYHEAQKKYVNRKVIDECIRKFEN